MKNQLIRLGSLIVAMLLVFIGCTDKNEKSYSDLQNECGFAYQPADTFLEKCGGCDIGYFQYEEMCFSPSTDELFSFEMPFGCMKGEQLLLNIWGEWTVEIIEATPPKLRVHEGGISTTTFNSWDEVKVHYSDGELIPDFCGDEGTPLSFMMFLHKNDFEDADQREVSGEIVWYEDGEENGRVDPIVLVRQPLEEPRERYDE